MMRECQYLEPLRQSLQSGHWPQAADETLRSHVALCDVCSAELLVAQRLTQMRADAIRMAPVGSASLLWWKARAAQRSEAMKRASRPILIAQIFAFAVAVLAVAVFVVTWALPLSQTGGVAQDGIWSWDQLYATWGALPLAGFVGVVLLLGGVAVYFAKDEA